MDDPKDQTDPVDVADLEAGDEHEETVIYLSDEDFDRLAELIANPPPPSERLRRLLTTKAPWEE